MLEPEKRVVSGLRPKAKTGGPVSASQSAGGASNSTRSVGARDSYHVRHNHSSVNNPMTLLGQMLLSWKLEPETSADITKYSAKESAAWSSSSSSSSAGQALEFRNTEEYIAHWLPLTVFELKASVVSSLQSQITGKSLSWTKVLVTGDVVTDSAAAASSQTDLSYLRCCEISAGFTDLSSSSHNSSGGRSGSPSFRKNEFSNMELVLLSMQPIISADLDKLLAGNVVSSKPVFALGLISSVNRVEGILHYNLTMASKNWDRFLLTKNTNPGKDKVATTRASTSVALHMLLADSLISGNREFVAINLLSRDDHSILHQQVSRFIILFSVTVDSAVDSATGQEHSNDNAKYAPFEPAN
jgi:hypothetical protein